jgi:cysteine synthase
MKVMNSVLEAIGNTPMVRLNKVSSNANAEILVKCEYLNPSGSIKDRMALYMICQAEKAGKIKKGGTIVESSTGNTAIALSFVSVVKGYQSKMFMPKGWVNEDRIRILKSFNAEITEISPGEEIERDLKDKSVHGSVVELIPRIKALEMEKNETNTWWVRQGLNYDNVLAHYETTGKEILEQTDGKIDAFVASIGTGGTLLGVAKALKEKIPDIEIYGVEPEGMPFFKSNDEIRTYMKKYSIPGVEGWLVEELRRSGLVKKCYLVNDKNAVDMARRLVTEEGLFVGISSGANVYVAKKIAKQLGKGKRVVTILHDRRDRYYTSEHYTT